MQYQEGDEIDYVTVNTTDTEVILYGLSSSTNYSIRVAAVNDAGTGKYSDGIYVLTEGGLNIMVKC